MLFRNKLRPPLAAQAPEVSYSYSYSYAFEPWYDDDFDSSDDSKSINRLLPLVATRTCLRQPTVLLHLPGAVSKIITLWGHHRGLILVTPRPETM